MGWGRPRVLYITGLNEAAAQGSLGLPGRVMRKVFGWPCSEPCGGGWAERETSRQVVWGKVWADGKWSLRSPNGLEAGWPGEVNRTWAEWVGGG